MNDPGSTVPAATRRLPADAAGLAEAAALLRTGRLVAFPTETVYGLGADATDPAAVTGIFAAKARPRFNPLISHLPDAAAALAEGVFDAPARRLAEAFWPGPLTLVVPAHAGTRVCDLARAADADRPAGPGMLASHYAPRARVRLDAVRVEPGEAVLLFGSRPPTGHETARASLNLSPAGDPAEAAARLFGALRDLDASGAETIAVAPIPADGLGEAIRDRLARAAAPR
ncbi:L-threonylcarbamoyladenylate synthase [Methylobacterium oryzae]|uniref:L-threonylcarbamoyladenylate synthase n=1 Tax=Methylobacterium oryzae TaxID=334852 RepID=A0ABU7TY28_9HYPH